MYLDPSFGGMLIQIIIAIVAAGGALAFGMRRKIAALFKKNKSVKAQSAELASSEGVVDMLADEDGNEK